MCEEIEQIEQQVDETGKVGRKVELLLTLAKKVYRSNTMQALAYAQRALALAESAGDKKLIADCHVGIGFCYRTLSRYDIALQYYEYALTLLEETGDSGEIAFVRSAIAILYDCTGRKKEAMSMCIRSLADSELYDNRKAMVQSLVTIAGLYEQFGCLPQALDILDKLRDLAEEQHNPVLLALCYLNIANIQSDIYNYGTALTYYMKSLELRRKSGDTWGEALTLLNIGGTFLQLKNPEEACRYLYQARTLFCELGDRAYEGTAVNSIGFMTEMLGDRDNALKCYERSLGLVQDTGHAEFKAHALGNIARIYCLDGLYSIAGEYIDKALAIARVTDNPSFLRQLARDAEHLYALMGKEDRMRQMRQLYIDAERRVSGPSLPETIIDVDQRLHESEMTAYRHQNNVLRNRMEQKEQELTTFALKLSQKNEFIRYVNRRIVQIIRNNRAGKTAMLQELLQQVRSNEESMDEYRKFEEQFTDVQREFTAELSRRYPVLTPTEIKICALLRMHLSSKQVASLLFLDVRTIDGHRYRIRKKLGLADKANLMLHLSTFHRPA